MKKAVTLFFMLCFLICISGPATEAAQTKPIYVALGDSIAAGYGLSDIRESYPSLLADKLGADNVNLAKNGRTSNGLLTQIHALSDSDREAISKAELITISIGGNDLIGSDNRIFVLSEALISVLSGDYTMSETLQNVYNILKENLIDTISALKQINPDAVILLQTLYNPYLSGNYTYGSYNVGELLDPYVNKLNEIYTEVYNTIEGFSIVDVASVMNGVPEYFYNTFDIHPTAAGHRIIADIIYSYYKTLTPEETESTPVSTHGETTGLPEIPSTPVSTEPTASSANPAPDTSAAEQSSSDITDTVPVMANNSESYSHPDNKEGKKSTEFTGILIIAGVCIVVLFAFVALSIAGRRKKKC